MGNRSHLAPLPDIGLTTLNIAFYALIFLSVGVACRHRPFTPPEQKKPLLGGRAVVMYPIA